MSQANSHAITLIAMVKLRAECSEALRVLGASEVILPAKEAATWVRDLEAAGLTMARE